VFNTRLFVGGRPPPKQAKTDSLPGRPTWYEYRPSVPISRPPTTGDGIGKCLQCLALKRTTASMNCQAGVQTFKATTYFARGAAKQMTQLCEYKSPPLVSSVHPVFLRVLGLDFRQSCRSSAGHIAKATRPKLPESRVNATSPASVSQRGSAWSFDDD
jgi:hypothetical protein